MNNWIANGTKLTGELVQLIPLGQEHFDDLKNLAADRRIWEYYPFDGTDPVLFLDSYQAALAEKEKGTQFPFAIFHKHHHKIIGSTRFLDIQARHRKLEIGFTWLHPDHWATAINLECKLLLLTYCFEVLETVRVQLKTDENNIRSRKAIEKIGGQFEGVLRNDMIRNNNTRRNSAYYSFIEEEWADKKSRLTILYEQKKASAGYETPTLNK